MYRHELDDLTFFVEYWLSGNSFCLDRHFQLEKLAQQAHWKGSPTLDLLVFVSGHLKLDNCRRLLKNFPKNRFSKMTSKWPAKIQLWTEDVSSSFKSSKKKYNSSTRPIKWPRKALLKFSGFPTAMFFIENATLVSLEGCLDDNSA